MIQKVNQFFFSFGVDLWCLIFIVFFVAFNPNFVDSCDHYDVYWLDKESPSFLFDILFWKWFLLVDKLEPAILESILYQIHKEYTLRSFMT